VSELKGALRLATKESDRAKALKEEFGKLGIGIEVEGDLMLVTGARPRGGRVDSRGDHRIAMAAAVAGLAAGGEVLIDGAECVAKSWPAFFDDLEALVVR
jgi:3-phosphoshikimate 1-carboxyvinyltransferase